MTTVAMRFDMRRPAISDAAPADLYRAAIEMSAWADANGVDSLTVSEHHGVDDGYLPSPAVMLSAIAAVTKRISLNVSAVLAPLHDPLRLAEDMAVLDLVSGGRLSIVLGMGYRPVEYEMFGRSWKGRGKAFDEIIETLQAAWTGEPFEYHGRTVQVTPRPVQQPHPILFIGGSSPAAAKRAARFGLGFFPAVGEAELGEIYRQASLEHQGHEGFCLLPEGPGFVHLAEDPDKAWAEIGEHILYEAKVYASWQLPGQRSHVTDYAQTVDELRAGGTYVILTPEQCIELTRGLGEMGSLIFHPLIGGMPPEQAWSSLELLGSKVLPAIR